MTNSRPPHLEQNPDAKQSVAFWRSGQGRITFASLVCGVFGAAWILLHSPHAAQVLAPISTPVDESTRISAVISDSLRDSRPGRNRWDRMDGGPLRQPLYVANLASQTGDYIVSVQRVNSDRYMFSSNPPYGVQFYGVEPIRLRLQVMSTRTGKMQRIDRFKTELSVVDNTGYRLNVLEDTREYEFPDGRGCLFQLTAPASDSVALGSIEGAIQLLPDARSGTNALSNVAGSSPAKTSPLSSAQILPFHIKNAPLPWRLHVFGMVGAAVLDANTARFAHLTTGNAGVNTPVTLQNEWMEQVVKAMPREAFQTPLRPPQPNSLALAEDTSNGAHLFAPAPRIPEETAPWRKRSLPLDCDITPHVQANGRIEARVKITGANAIAVEARVSVWDNTPVIVAIPASRLYPGEPAESMFVLYLRLYLDNPPPQEMFNGAIPKEWRAKKGASGGALSGEIVTDKGAFGIGTATLNVQRGDQAGSRGMKQASLIVGLDSLGRFNLPNLAAGHYRVELGDVHPYQSAAIAPCSFEEYLKRHLGIRQATVNVGAQEADVRAGDRAQLPPWIFKNARIPNR